MSYDMSVFGIFFCVLKFCTLCNYFRWYEFFISNNSYFLSSVFFEIRNVVDVLLDELLPFLITKSTKGRTVPKTWVGFSETGPFDVPLPFVAMFFLRPFYSNLLMSPELNTRHVPCDVFHTIPPEKHHNLRDILYSNDDQAVASFRSRRIVLFPYKLGKKGNIGEAHDTNGVPIKSVSSYKVKDGDSSINNTVVTLDNAIASNISSKDFEKFMALFGRSVDGRPGVYNFEDFLVITSLMSDSKELLVLLGELGFPEELVDESLRFEVNMRNLASFIMMCSPVYFGAPEGQTRLEAVSRPCFGYPLYGVAPLRDDKGRRIEDFVEQEFLKTSQYLPHFSTAFNSVTGSVVYTPKPVFTPEVLKELVDLSKMVQDNSSTEVSTTYQTFYQLIVSEISEQFHKHMRPIDDAAFANFDVTYESAEKRATRSFLLNETRITTLYKTLNSVLIDKMFTSRPFNLQIPQDNEDKTLKCTKEKFLKLTEGDANWFVLKPFYSVFQCVININYGLEGKKKKKGYYGSARGGIFLTFGTKQTALDASEIGYNVQKF